MGPFTVGQVPALPQIFIIYNDDGSQRDLTSYDTITVNMIQPDGSVTHPGSCSIPDAGGNPGKVALTWDMTTPFQEAGFYTIQLQFNGPGGILDYSDTETFAVEPASGTSIPTWATSADVANMTGISVRDDQLALAEHVIELVSNRTPDASGVIQRRDIIWLKKAVAFQAAWQASQTDLLGRSSVDGVSGDGFNSKFSSKASLYLAPLAERALKNVSWLRTRSLRMQIPLVDGDYLSPDALVDDSILNWEAM